MDAGRLSLCGEESFGTGTVSLLKVVSSKDVQFYNTVGERKTVFFVHGKLDYISSFRWRPYP